MLCLGYAYWKVTGDVSSITTANKILQPILMGIVGTVAVFLVFIRIYNTNSSKNEKCLF